MEFLDIIDEKKERLDGLSDYIWDNPEIAFQEHKAAQALIELLQEEGFSVQTNLGNIPTAFSGTYGTTKPVIGIFGEFDALSGMDQKADCAQKCSEGKAYGHGCGHNLLGVGSLAAALSIKHWLEQTGASGTVVYFGCPAEEGGSAKAFMARDGVFNGLDAALSWHPKDATRVKEDTSLANYQILYRFDGTAAHAAQYPHLGRSALDAVELMNVGVNFLREHIPTNHRVHYSITDAGGMSPNVVQAHAEVLYLLRAPSNAEVAQLYQRVNAIAEGAAMMTQTTASQVFVKACSNLVLNDTLQQLMYESAQVVALPVPTAEDVDFAREIVKTFPQHTPQMLQAPLNNTLTPITHQFSPGFGSTDVADVSWVCPTAQLLVSTWAVGTPGHTWQATAQGKRTYAREMMRYAGKVLAQTAVELLKNPELLSAAKDELSKEIGPDGYIPPIPQNVYPFNIVK